MLFSKFYLVFEKKLNNTFFGRKLAENRSQVALEKEKIRRDYELMSIQLSEILKNNELANSFVHVSKEIISERSIQTTNRLLSLSD